MSMKHTNTIAIVAIFVGAAVGIGATLALTGDRLDGIQGVEIDCMLVAGPRSKAAQRSIRIVYRGTGPDAISQGCRQYQVLQARLEALGRAQQLSERLEGVSKSAEAAREREEALREMAEALRKSSEQIRERLEEGR